MINVDFCLGHSDLVTGHYNDWLNKVDSDPGRGLKNARQTSEVAAPQVYEPAISAERYPTRYIEERTIAWLEQHASSRSDEPFFMQCSFPDPHHPFTPPGKYYSKYSPNDVELPQSFHSPNKDATPPVRFLWNQYESGDEPNALDPFHS